jgi:hypothetical protein
MRLAVVWLARPFPSYWGAPSPCQLCTHSNAQNQDLLAKFRTKIHSDSTAPWACWFRHRYGWSSNHDLGDRHHIDSPIWKAIVAGVSSLRSVSKSSVGNGASTAFWLDLWLGELPLADRFPTLFSHSTRPNTRVSLILSFGLRPTLVPRLSNVATADLLALSTELADTSPTYL